jgi:hypothetical protein
MSKQKQTDYPRIDCHNGIWFKQIDKNNIAFYIDTPKKEKVDNPNYDENSEKGSPNSKKTIIVTVEGELSEEFIGYYRMSPSQIILGLRKAREYYLYNNPSDNIDNLIQRFEELILLEANVFEKIMKEINDK